METTYQTIPGFPKHELGTNNVVRGIKNKTALSLKKGTGKYYLPNDKGEYKLITLEAIKNLLPKEEPKAATPKREPKPRKFVTAEHVLQLQSTTDVKGILDAKLKQHEKIYLLHELKFNNHEIAGLLGCTPGNVSRGIWMYKSNRKKINKANG
jgi:hypothetical protein